MHIHILGICGTFMGSLAVLAKQQGHKVTGCDQNVYPPMSTQLEQQGIDLIEGFDEAQLDLSPDLFVIGNAISRGNPLLEAILNKGLPCTSGPQMLADHVLPGKWVLAISGTHGKTTTTAMLAWILEDAGMSPGFLIGGVPQDFDCSARLGSTPFFVIEADEYDSAFFDKRSKFVHYRPKTLVVNNLEFDHADIFADLSAIKTQFHHLIRTIPSEGRVIYPKEIADINDVLERGCWSEQAPFSFNTAATEKQGSDEDALQTADDEASAVMIQPDGSEFEVHQAGQHARVSWSLSGRHNVSNAVAAMLAARHVGVTLSHSAAALSRFKGVKRRLELLDRIGATSVYDDFAHHPTAIETTLEGLRNKVGSARIIAIIEPRSNTMKMGVHEKSLMPSAAIADHVIWANLGGLDWLEQMLAVDESQHQLAEGVSGVLDACLQVLRHQNEETETHIVLMSNGGFGGVHSQLIDAIKTLSSRKGE